MVDLNSDCIIESILNPLLGAVLTRILELEREKKAVIESIQLDGEYSLEYNFNKLEEIEEEIKTKK